MYAWNTLCDTKFWSLWSLLELETLIHTCHSIYSPRWPQYIFITILLLSFIINLSSSRLSSSAFSSPSLISSSSLQKIASIQNCAKPDETSVQFFYINISFTFLKSRSYGWQGSCKRCGWDGNLGQLVKFSSQQMGYSQIKGAKSGYN